nr:uncharacterized protein LOC109160086 isoform X7 [Ipomoea trifida]
MLSTVGAMAAVAKAASTAYYYAEHFGVFNREAKGEAETRSVEVAENQSANVGIHLFNGIGYDIWSSKMKSLFLSQDLWDMVEGGYIEEELTVEVLREVRKKDAMALLFIQQAIDKSVFSCITGANKSKEAWDALQKKYEGDGMTKSTKVYVANLSESTTKKDLREAFGYFGKIASTVVVRDEDGKSKCFGFVNFKDADNASWSIEVLNGHKFDDKEWCVRRYQKKSVKRAKNKSVDESVANASKSKKAGNAVSEKKITGKPEKQSVDESLPSSSAKDTCSQLVEPWGVTPVTMPTPSASSVAGSSSTVVAAPSSSHTVTAPVLHDEAVVPSRRPGRGRGQGRAKHSLIQTHAMCVSYITKTKQRKQHPLNAGRTRNLPPLSPLHEVTHVLEANLIQRNNGNTPKPEGKIRKQMGKLRGRGGRILGKDGRRSATTPTGSADSADATGSGFASLAGNPQARGSKVASRRPRAM